MKRILILLFFSSFLLFQIGCEKAPDSPVTPDLNQGTEKGFTQESLYEIPGIPPIIEGCGDFTTDLLICPSIDDIRGLNSLKVGTLTVSDDCDNLIFTFTIIEPGYFITNAVGNAWVYTPVDNRYVPPIIRDITETHDVSEHKVSVTLTMPKDYIYYVGPIMKDASFRAGDILGVAGYVQICTKEGFQLPATLPTTTTINYVSPNPDNPGSPLSYLNVDTDDPFLGIDNKGWCVDLSGNILQNTNILVNVYSSPLPIPPGLIDNPDSLGMVNWILNNVHIGDVVRAGGPPITYREIQNAIWKIVDDGSFSLAPFDPASVRAIVDMSRPHLNFVPGCKQLFAVILAPSPHNSQVIIIEKPVKCTLGDGCYDACAFGNSRYCLDLPGFPGGFWHWVTVGYVFCCPE